MNIEIKGKYKREVSELCTYFNTDKEGLLMFLIEEAYKSVKQQEVVELVEEFESTTLVTEQGEN